MESYFYYCEGLSGWLGGVGCLLNLTLYSNLFEFWFDSLKCLDITYSRPLRLTTLYKISHIFLFLECFFVLLKIIGKRFFVISSKIFAQLFEENQTVCLCFPNNSNAKSFQVYIVQYCPPQNKEWTSLNYLTHVLQYL